MRLKHLCRLDSMGRMARQKYFLVFFFIFSQNVWLLASGCNECCLSCDATDCQDWYDLGHTTSGVYHVTPCGTRFGYDVYCDMETDGGGWLVFQRRINGSENFYREWKSYEHGFGNITWEFWFGLLPLRRIVSNGEYELRVDLVDFNNEVSYAKYGGFSIGNSASNYTLEAVDYSGDAGDGLAHHNGLPFSTFDNKNDMHDVLNCAEYLRGAWWFRHCMESHLNGEYYCCEQTPTFGIVWKKRNDDSSRTDYSIRKTEMKIRRV